MGCRVSTPLPPQAHLADAGLILMPSAGSQFAQKDKLRAASDVGVSLAFLLKFASAVPVGWSSGQVMQEMIKPQSAPYRKRYADIPSLVPSNHLGTPTLFISHCWCNPFSLLVSAVKTKLIGAVASETFVWLDLFAMNQHTSSESGADLGDLRGNLEKAISKAAGTVVVLDPTGGPCMRVWCLLELWTTVRLKGSDALHLVMPPGSSMESLGQTFQQINVSKAQATLETDRDLILGWIQDTPAGPTETDTSGDARIRALNVMLRLLFLLHPLDYSADLRTKEQHQGTDTWDMKRIQQWHDGTERSLYLQGPAGAGKSTLTAALIRDRRLVQAYHFCKDSDVRRQEPLRVVHTLAFQLGTLPNAIGRVISEELMKLDASQVSQVKESLDTAVDLLINRPVTKACKEMGMTSITVLIDGLDEADSANSASLALSNRIWGLVRDTLSRIKSLRIIITSRPHDHLVQGLEAVFGPLCSISLECLLDEAALLSLVTAHLRDYKEAEAKAKELLGNGGSNRVYVPVTLELLKRGWVTTNTLPTGVDAAYAQVLCRSFELIPSVQADRVNALISVLLASCEPLAPADLEQLDLWDVRTLLPLWGVLYLEQDQRIFVLHKSWAEFMQSKLLPVAGPGLGHSMLAKLDWRASKYALRNSITHLCQADDATALTSTLLDFSGFWREVHSAGQGSSVLRDLALLQHLAPTDAQHVVKDVLRWLTGCTAVLSKHPECTLQLACDAPLDSVVATSSAELGEQHVPWLLQTKERHFSPTKAVLTGHARNINALVTTPDGKYLITAGSDRTIRVWETVTGDCTAVLAGHASAVNCLALHSLNGALMLVSGSGNNSLTHSYLSLQADLDSLFAGQPKNPKYNDIKIWNLKSGICVTTLADQHDGCILCVAVDESCMFSGARDTLIKAWDVPSGQPLFDLNGHKAAVTCMAVSMPGTLISGSEDKTVRVWDLSTKSCLHELSGHTSAISCLAVSTDQLTLATGSHDKTIRVWDLHNCKCKGMLEGHEKSVTGMAFMNSNSIISGSLDLLLRVWDITQGSCTATAEGHGALSDKTGLTEGPTVVACCPDGTIFSGAQDGAVRAWDPQLLHVTSNLEKHTAKVTAAAVSPDGMTVASSCVDKTIGVWDVCKGRWLRSLSGHQDRVNHVVFSNDGNVVATGAGWLQEDSYKLMVASMQINYDTGRVDRFRGHDVDNSVKLWAVRTGECLTTLDGHLAGVVDIAFSLDDSSIVSSDQGGLTIMWSENSSIELSAAEYSKWKEDNRIPRNALQVKDAGTVIQIDSHCLAVTPPYLALPKCAYLCCALDRVVVFSQCGRFLLYKRSKTTD